MKKRTFNCPVEVTLLVIGGRWKALILWHLQEGVRRFGELRRLIPEATQKMLTQQLRELEADGLIHRKIFPVVPPRVEYSVTDSGKSLKPILKAMCDWGGQHLRQYERVIAASEKKVSERERP
jgi:DNA-binding HxlR family transcriptional regulator